MTINLEKEVKAALKDYTDEVKKSSKEVISEVAKEAAKQLKQTSPRRTGKYAKGWTSKVEESRIGATATVYGGKNTYPLAHLLEHGHAARGGGRVPGIVHIQPVEDWAIDEAVKRIEKRIQ